MKEQFERFRELYERYEKATRCPHIHALSPCDPSKMQYKKTLREMVEWLEKHPELMDLLIEVRHFEEAFGDGRVDK